MQVVLGRNWSAVVFKYDLKHGDFLEFKINAFWSSRSMHSTRR
jgi:hypothetical protein